MPPLPTHWIASYGLGAIFGLLVLGVFGLPVPDETLMAFAGVLVRQGHLGFATTWIAAALGSMCGISLSYTLGRTVGTSLVVRYGRWVRITDAHLRRVEQWMEHGGRWTLMFGYFVPGIRHLTAIVAGSSGLPPRIFMTFAYAGAAVWSLTFVTLGWYVGDRWEAVLHTLHHHLAIATALVVILAAAYFLIHARRVRRRGV